MYLLVGVDVASVAGKLNWFFAHMAVLVYFHVVPAFSARVNLHQSWYGVVCIKGA